MDTAGLRLKRARERLKLRYRDVEEASQRIADRHGNPEYGVALSRLSDIENKGTVPSIYRLFSLCAIYRLDFSEVANWYGVRIGQLGGEAGQIELESTHLLEFPAAEAATLELPPDVDAPGFDPSTTTFLGHMQRWAKSAAGMLAGYESRHHRFAYIGLNDRHMYPLLQPGALVIIDQRQRKIATGGWTNEFERPLYFFEHREGFACSWCSLVGEHQLILQPHPASQCAPAVFHYPTDIEVIGQVAGVAMLLYSKKRRSVRSGATPAASPDR